MKKILLTNAGRSTNTLISYMKKIFVRNIDTQDRQLPGKAGETKNAALTACEQQVKNGGKNP